MDSCIIWVMKGLRAEVRGLEFKVFYNDKFTATMLLIRGWFLDLTEYMQTTILLNLGVIFLVTEFPRATMLLIWRQFFFFPSLWYPLNLENIFQIAARVYQPHDDRFYWIFGDFLSNPEMTRATILRMAHDG